MNTLREQLIDCLNKKFCGQIYWAKINTDMFQAVGTIKKIRFDSPHYDLIVEITGNDGEKISIRVSSQYLMESNNMQTLYISNCKAEPKKTK